VPDVATGQKSKFRRDYGGLYSFWFSIPSRIRTCGLVLRRSSTADSLPVLSEVNCCFACPRVTATPRCLPADRARNGHARGSAGRLTLSMRTPGGEVIGGRWSRSSFVGSLSEAFPADRVAVLVRCTALRLTVSRYSRRPQIKSLIGPSSFQFAEDRYAGQIGGCTPADRYARGRTATRAATRARCMLTILALNLGTLGLAPLLVFLSAMTAVGSLLDEH
jgi:hypothetical protein